MFKEKLCKQLRLKDIKDCNIEYYYTKYPEWNREYNIEPMFDDIEAYQYHQPLEKLDYSVELIKYAQKWEGKMITKVDDATDQIILEYIKCRPQSHLITIWDKVDFKDVNNYLLTLGNVYYVKYIKLSFKAAHSLVYQIFADTDKYKNIDDITNLLKDIYKFKGGYITVVVFDNIKKEDNNLVRLCINQILNRKTGVYITHKFYRTIEDAMIYFCKNSLIFLEEQLLERHIEIRMRSSRILLATIKRWICAHMKLDQRRDLLLIGSCILYTYGIRNCKDIDLYINPHGYNQQVEKYLINEESKFDFLDSIMPDSHRWFQYWNQWTVKWAQLIGANNFDEIIYNPQYHYYYMGMKFMILDGDIERRFIRKRPKSMVDLLEINRLLNRNINIPIIPRVKRKYIHVESEPLELELEIGQKYNPINKEIEYEISIDMDRYLETMKWYFKVVYYREYSIDEIKNMVGIRKIKIKSKN